ncbi:hypothetical protein B0H14DRAFT_1417502 [Mycena olivaceomarginata]|nr:hypothetical protein B0H14DRAFT_1417502 [Mycena olivaceomarginata]
MCKTWRVLVRIPPSKLLTDDIACLSDGSAFLKITGRGTRARWHRRCQLITRCGLSIEVWISCMSRTRGFGSFSCPLPNACARRRRLPRLNTKMVHHQKLHIIASNVMVRFLRPSTSERVRATPSMTTQYTNRSIHQNRQIIHSLKAVLWSLCPPAPERALVDTADTDTSPS